MGIFMLLFHCHGFHLPGTKHKRLLIFTHDCGCQYFILLTLKKKTIRGHRGPGFFNKKLILDYYFCLKSSPVDLNKKKRGGEFYS
jgi:hypothetical protein